MRQRRHGFWAMAALLYAIQGDEMKKAEIIWL